MKNDKERSKTKIVLKIFGVVFRIIASGTNIPFPDCTFDNVVSYGVLRYVPDHMAYLKEVYRVLKPNGKFFLSTIRKRWQKETLRRITFWLSSIIYVGNLYALKYPEGNGIILDVNGNPHKIYDKFWDEEELIAILERIGFKLIFKTRVGYHLPGIKLITHYGYNPRKHGYFLFFILKKKEAKVN